MSYYATNNVEVFPSAFRTTRPNGKFTSENNFINILNSLTDIEYIGSESDGFVVSFNETSKVLDVVIHGYFFEITGINKPTGDLWLSIRVSNNLEAIVPYTDESIDSYDLNNQFTALAFFDHKPSNVSTSNYSFYNLKVFSNGVINKIKFATDSILFKDGNRTLTDELNSKQYELTSGNGISTITNSKDSANVIKLTDDVYNSIISLINKGRGGQSLISFDSKGVATDSNANIGGYDTSKKVFRHIYINNGQVTLGPTITASPNNPSGGSPGDIWLKYTE